MFSAHPYSVSGSLLHSSALSHVAEPALISKVRFTGCRAEILKRQAGRFNSLALQDRRH